MSRLITLAAGLLIASSAAALAHSVEARFEEQAGMIESGRQNGSITWREGRALRKEQAEIAHVKAELEADGSLSRADKRILFGLQDQAESNIQAEATDTLHRALFLPRIGR